MQKCMRATPSPLTILATIFATTSALTPAIAAAAPPPQVTPPLAYRYIAITSNADDECETKSPNWTGKRLFRNSKQAQLRRYCVFTVIDPKGEGFPTSEFLRADPDYDVLLPQGDLGADHQVRTALRDTWRKSMGLSMQSQTLYGGKAPGVLKLSPTPPIDSLAQVAVLDTADRLRPYASATPARQHGLAMAEIIREVRCPAGEAACVPLSTFVPVIAPPSESAPPFDRPTVANSSENLGSLGTLAQGIHETVTTWQTFNKKNPHPDAPLVLNLSVGWDPRWVPPEWVGSGPWDITDRVSHNDLINKPSDAIPAPVQAVHAALVRASCFDVLAIAAAGNNTAGACEQQNAMAPAVWEQMLAPDREFCEILFAGELPKERPGKPKLEVKREALVYAAGGLLTMTSAAPLPTSRMGETAPRFVPASHVVVGSGSNRTDAWTGTSVAAAAISGLAANLWSYDLRLTSHQVMALIDASGADGPTLPAPSLLRGAAPPNSPWTRPEHAVRVSPDRAFKNLCLADGPLCARNPYIPPLVPGDTSLTSAVADEQPEIPNQSTWLTPLTRKTIASGCPTKRTHYFAAALASAAPPVSASPSVMAWTRPQPETPICSVCPIKDKKLILSLSPDQTSSALFAAGPTVTLDNPLLEFRFGKEGYISVSLGQLTIDKAAGRELSLESYKVELAGGAVVSLAKALEDNAITAGTLTVFVPDGTQVKSLVSVIPVLD